MKHDVSSCGCDSTELPFQLRRENSVFQITFVSRITLSQELSSWSFFSEFESTLLLCKTTSSTLGSS